jgi:hypothetical protein
MAIIVEKFDSGGATIGPDSPSVDLLFAVLGTESDIDVRALVESTIPAIFRGMVFQNYRIDHKGGGVWDVSVRYGRDDSQADDAAPNNNPPQPGDPLGPSYTFETSGGTQHITQSLQTIAKHAKPLKNAPDFKGAIGVNGDSIEGTDITVPIFRFSETYSIPVGLITHAYKLTVFDLTGKVNDAPFKGFAAGDVLFLGASGSQRGIEKWEITYQFAASKNAVGLQVGDIQNINKKGWEYLWVRYGDVEDQKVLVKQPESVYIERVYDSGNFANLGIGV